MKVDYQLIQEDLQAILEEKIYSFVISSVNYFQSTEMYVATIEIDNTIYSGAGRTISELADCLCKNAQNHQISAVKYIVNTQNMIFDSIF